MPDQVQVDPAVLAPLPTDAVLVHLGPHKTGTSAIQSVLASSRPDLQAHGVDYPGDSAAHHVAAKALRRMRSGWAEDSDPPPPTEVWDRLAGHVAANPGRVIVSSEFLARAEDDARVRLAESLGAQRVHVLLVAREPGAHAVSMWQQILKEGYGVTLEEWLEKHFRRRDPGQHASFWETADAGALVRAWADTVGIDRVSVLALDEGDHSLLPHTVERLLDLPDGLLSGQAPPKTNRGLTGAEAALLLQVNRQVRQTLTWSEYNRMIRNGMVSRLLDHRRPPATETKERLPEWARSQAAAESEHLIEDLRSTGVRVIGDLATLRTPPARVGNGAPVTGLPVDLAATAVGAALAVLPSTARDGRTRQVGDVPTRELARILLRRVRAGVRRRYRRRVRIE